MVSGLNIGQSQRGHITALAEHATRLECKMNAFLLSLWTTSCSGAVFRVNHVFPTSGQEHTDIRGHLMIVVLKSIEYSGGAKMTLNALTTGQKAPTMHPVF